MGSYTVWPPLVHFFYIPLMQCSQESSMLSWCSSGWTIVLCANLLCTISCLRGMTYSYICNSFISSGCLIAQASVCSPILKKSWDTGQPCLILILMGLDFKALSNVPVTSFAVYTFMHFQMHFCCWLRVSFFFFSASSVGWLRASHMQVSYSTTELQPQLSLHSDVEIYLAACQFF